MNIEQELSDFLDIAIGGIEYPNMNILAKAILSSGLVIPVSVLDGMVEKVAEVMGETAINTWPDTKDKTLLRIMAKAAINAIKEEMGECRNIKLN